MRKTTCLLLILAMLCALAGCAAPGSSPEPTASPTPEPTATAEPTAAADMPYALLWNGMTYTGTYTGAIRGGAPEGGGVFTGVNPAGQVFAWDGGWRGGVPSGEGELTVDGLTARLEGESVTGDYVGRAVDCLPEGEGIFTGADCDGVVFTYTGHWSAGEMDGEGTLRYDAANSYVRTGQFTAGTFTPDWVGALAVLGSYEPAFTLSETQLAFIDAHPELWESESHLSYLNSAYKRSYNRTLTIRKLFQQPELVGEPCWIPINSLRVLRSYVVTLGEHSFTCITASESTYTYAMRVILPDAVEGLRRGQRFHASVMPLAMSEYVTVNGQTQPCLVLLAGDAYISNSF